MGFCKFTQEDMERTVPAGEWLTPSAQSGRFSLTANAFQSYQIFIEQACLQIKCSKKQKQMAKEMKRALQDFQTRTRKNNPY